MSDGKETVPSNPDNPKGAYTAARTAKDQGVPISTVSFGTPYGTVDMNGQQTPVPVDDEMLKKIAQLSEDETTPRRTSSNSKRSSPTFRSRSATRREGRCRHGLAAARRSGAGVGCGGRAADQPATPN